MTYHDMLQAQLRKANPKAQVWAITLLVNDVPVLTKDKVKEAVSTVLGADVAAKMSDEKQFGPTQKFDVATDGYFLSVEATKRIYCEFVAIMSMPTIIGDAAVLEAFEQHRSFVAVSVVSRDPAGRDAMYAALGKIAAKFLDSTVVCVHCRAGDVYLKAGDEVARVLRGEDPKSVVEFFEERKVIGVRRGDPEMLAAMNEARRRLPEFLEVWKTHAGRGMFMVKAKFETDGRVEYLWISPKAIDGERVSGSVLNHPRHATHVHKDQTVTMPLSAVMDWAYAVAGKADGGFTDSMVRAAVGKR